MGRPLRLLVVEDSEDDALLLVRALERGGFDLSFERVDTQAALTSCLEKQEWDLVIADYSMPHFSGTAALKVVREKGYDMPFIFVSGTIGEDIAVSAMRGGAQDYLMKGNLARLVPAVERELREVEGRRAHSRMEKNLRQLEKFETIGRLAGGIAHDFNNVLGAIIGWSELALEELPQGAPLRPHLEKIRHQADRAAALTRQLLAFARRQILEPRNVNLNHTITETLGLLEKVIGKDIEVRTLLPAELRVTRADPSQLEQVLMNLCLNARDAMPQGGNLVIETQNVTFDEEYCRLHTYVRAGNYVMLSVSDNGVGMDPKTIEHIFEPFFSTKETGKGTGLGLATVYGIVKQHGGFVNAYSEPGHGSTFRIYLPAIAGEHDVDAPALAEKPRGGTETILVAEDHDGVRELIQETLAKHGYNVLMAHDGNQAVEMFRAHAGDIALLVLDVVMPRMGGPEAFGQIAQLRSGVPVIFCTGYSSEMAQLSSAATVGATILQKPFTPSTLARKIRETLDAAKKS